MLITSLCSITIPSVRILSHYTRRTKSWLCANKQQGLIPPHPSISRQTIRISIPRFFGSLRDSFGSIRSKPVLIGIFEFLHILCTKIHGKTVLAVSNNASWKIFSSLPSAAQHLSSIGTTHLVIVIADVSFSRLEKAEAVLTIEERLFICLSSISNCK
jgi:hypothetical protein